MNGERHTARIYSDKRFAVSCSCGFASREFLEWDEMVDAWDAHLPSRSPYVAPLVRATLILRKVDNQRVEEIITRYRAA